MKVKKMKTIYFRKGRKGGYIAFLQGKVVLPARWGYQPAEEGDYVVKEPLIDKGRFYLAEVVGPAGTKKIYACGHEEFERGIEFRMEHIPRPCEKCLDEMFEAHKSCIPSDIPASFKETLLERFRFLLRKEGLEKALQSIQNKVALFRKAVDLLEEAYKENLPIRLQYEDGFPSYYQVGEKKLSKEMSSLIFSNAKTLVEVVTGVDLSSFYKKAQKVENEVLETIKKDFRFQKQEEKWFICSKCGCQEYQLRLIKVTRYYSELDTVDQYRPSLFLNSEEEREFCKRCGEIGYAEYYSKSFVKELQEEYEKVYEKDGIKVFLKIVKKCYHATQGSINVARKTYSFSVNRIEATDPKIQKALEFLKKLFPRLDRDIVIYYDKLEPCGS